MIRRRSFLAGLFSAFAAPAIVRAESLMPVKGIIMPVHEIIIPRRMPVLPRCDHCFGPWGMCSHTGGPMNLDDMRLDSRVVENLAIDKHDYALMRKLNI